MAMAKLISDDVAVSNISIINGRVTFNFTRILRIIPFKLYAINISNTIGIICVTGGANWNNFSAVVLIKSAEIVISVFGDFYASISLVNSFTYLANAIVRKNLLL